MSSDLKKKIINKYVPNPDQMKLWPKVSGNDINGLGEKKFRRPSPVYWRPSETIPHGPLQDWFYKNFLVSNEINEERAKRQKVMDAPLSKKNKIKIKNSPEGWTRKIKNLALEFGAEDVGITRMNNDWVFEDKNIKGRWVIVIAVKHNYESLSKAPKDPAAVEVLKQYTRALKIVKKISSWILDVGCDAWPHGGPMAGDIVMIPAAISAGLGELGKHGSIINKKLGSNFRLGLVLTDLPLLPDKKEEFGADNFCMNCQLCSTLCPPKAISQKKQWVRGQKRWYVNFDLCLPFFNENKGCGICIAVCPWSRPGVAGNLIKKFNIKKKLI